MWAINFDYHFIFLLITVHNLVNAGIKVQYNVHMFEVQSIEKFEMVFFI